MENCKKQFQDWLKKPREQEILPDNKNILLNNQESPSPGTPPLKERSLGTWWRRSRSREQGRSTSRGRKDPEPEDSNTTPLPLHHLLPLAHYKIPPAQDSNMTSARVVGRRHRGGCRPELSLSVEQLLFAVLLLTGLVFSFCIKNEVEIFFKL